MRLILFLLKCLVGLFATVGFLIAVGLLSIAFLWEEFGELRVQRLEVPQSTVLTLELGSGLVEALPESPLARASQPGVVVLREALESLERAAADPRVKGLILRLGRGNIGLANMQELRAAVTEFRHSGKFTAAFAESFGEGGDGTKHYYLASAAEEVWLQPSGDLDLTGFLIESPFLGDALERIGVEPQMAQREEYKGAMNTLTDNALPAPQRRNLQRLVDAWLQQVIAGIAESRGLAEAEVRQGIDQGPYLGAQALAMRLIDRLGYWDQFSDAVQDRAGVDAEYLSLAQYHDASAEDGATEATFALVHGLGPVVLDESENDPLFGRVSMGADTVAEAIADAVDDPEIEAILFRIDSPGGSYVASDTIWREVQRAREAGKPLIVSFGNVAASGGYFVAAPAAKIVAQPTTVTGSIGVVGGKVALAGLWRELSVNWDGVKAGANADFWSTNRTFDDAGWARLQESLDRTYEDFRTKVGAGRGLDAATVRGLAKGQVWSGSDALQLGLVDALGGYREALALAREAAGLEPDSAIELRPFPEPRDPLEALFESAFGGGIESPGLTSLARGLAGMARVLAPLTSLQARLTEDPRSQVLRAPTVPQ